jgi:hypothetical protein
MDRAQVASVTPDEAPARLRLDVISELRELLRNSSQVTKYKNISTIDSVLATGE